MHWVLDVTFREDRSRARDAQANLGVLRRVALSMLKNAADMKGSIDSRRKQAGWHEETLEIVHDVGGAAERSRRAEVQAWREPPALKRGWPEPEVTPRRVYVSCDGILYCTNQREPDPHDPQRRHPHPFLSHNLVPHAFLNSS